MSVTFERLVVLRNPRSSNAQKTDGVIADLTKAFPGKVTACDLGATDAANRQLLKDTLRPGDILLPAGGDGTLSSVISCLFHESVPPQLRSTKILPIGVGRYNDIARILNGRYFRRPQYVLKHGQEQTVYPLRCELTPHRKTAAPRTIIALHSVGFGYTAEAGAAYNDPDFRARQRTRSLLAKEAELVKTSLGLLKNAKYFDITYKGKRQAVLDITAANSQRIGVYYRMPTKLSKPEFFFTMSDDKSPLRTMRTVAELLTNTYSSGELVTSATFTLHTPALAHQGGEPFTPPAPCDVHISLGPHPVILLATSPKA